MARPNIILITVDSLRFDHLGCYGYHRNTSPNIDALASKGVKFTGAISNGGNTAHAFPSIMASLPPPLGRGEYIIASCQGATLAEVLRKAGYQTAAFHSNPVLSRFTGYGRGFNMFDDGFSRFNAKSLRLWVRTRPRARKGLIAKVVKNVGKMLKPVERPIVSAEEITNRALSWINNNCTGEKFLWLHYMDVHWPYMPEAKYINQFSDHAINRQLMQLLYRKMLDRPQELLPDEIKTIIDLYDANIKYSDEEIGRLLGHLESYLDNIFIIVTADHGEALGEHGWFGHGFVYEELLHVPLIIAGPTLKSGIVVRDNVELMDLAPTVLDFAGLKKTRTFQGQSLLPVMAGGCYTSRGMISTITNKFHQAAFVYRTPEWKYIRTESLDDANTVLSEELYNLKRDSQERHNLHGSEDGETRAFEVEAVNKILEFKERKIEGKTAYEKERVKAKIKKLGKL